MRFVQSFYIALMLASPSSALAELPTIETTALPTDEKVRYFADYLANGLHVVVSPQPLPGRAWLAVFYHVGARDDPDGYHGLAHLTEHLSFRGSAVPAEYQDLGASVVNGYTTPDETFYCAQLPTTSLERALWLESTRMAFMLDEIGERDLARERTIVTHEWRQNVHNHYGEEIAQRNSDLVFPKGHPYHRLGDDPDDVEALTLPNVQWFAQGNYQPSRATLVVTGDVDPEQVFAWAARYFGPVKPAAPVRARAVAPRQQPLSQSCHSTVRATDNGLVLNWAAPAADSDDAAALDVIGALLTHRRAGRLTRALTLASGPASSVLAVHDERELGSRFVLGVFARGTEPVAPLLERVDAELAELAAGQLDEEELAAARRYAKREFIVEPSSMEFLVHLGRAARGVKRRGPEAYTNLTVADVQRVAKHWLSPRRRVVMELRKKEHSARSARCRDVEKK